jgi:hypothetical protein
MAVAIDMVRRAAARAARNHGRYETLKAMLSAHLVLYSVIKCMGQMIGAHQTMLPMMVLCFLSVVAVTHMWETYVLDWSEDTNGMHSGMGESGLSLALFIAGMAVSVAVAMAGNAMSELSGTVFLAGSVWWSLYAITLCGLLIFILSEMITKS